MLPAVHRTAADLDVGESVVIDRIDGRGAVTVRLLEMGLVPGTSLKVVKRAPLGDPLQLQLRGFHLSLRRAEASLVLVREAKAG